jgi:hypothetical protein
MADTFYAATNIHHAHRVEDGSADGKLVTMDLVPGDEVKGIPSANMKSLWDAGALTRTPPEKEEATSDEGPASDSVQTPTKSATPSKAAAPKVAS